MLPDNYMEERLTQFLILIKYGGFSRESLRAMPIWERSFYLKKLQDFYKPTEENA